MREKFNTRENNFKSRLFYKHKSAPVLRRDLVFVRQEQEEMVHNSKNEVAKWASHNAIPFPELFGYILQIKLQKNCEHGTLG